MVSDTEAGSGWCGARGEGVARGEGGVNEKRLCVPLEKKGKGIPLEKLKRRPTTIKKVEENPPT